MKKKSQKTKVIFSLTSILVGLFIFIISLTGFSEPSFYPPIVVDFTSIAIHGDNENSSYIDGKLSIGFIYTRNSSSRILVDSVQFFDFNYGNKTCIIESIKNENGNSEKYSVTFKNQEKGKFIFNCDSSYYLNDDVIGGGIKFLLEEINITNFLPDNGCRSIKGCWVIEGVVQIRI
jgi:hypothetical protein